MDLTTIIILVIIAVLVIGAFVFLWFKNRKIAKKIVLSLVLEAENKWGAKTGAIKYSYVVGLVYPRLPWFIKLFITETMLGNFIDEAIEFMESRLGEKEVQGLIAPAP